MCQMSNAMLRAYNVVTVLFLTYSPLIKTWLEYSGLAETHDTRPIVTFQGHHSTKVMAAGK